MHSPHGNSLSPLTLFFSLPFPLCPPLLVCRPCAEKEKRVKSGSDGEGASSSQSDSSASLGSLKGGGESPIITSLSPPRRPHRAAVSSGRGEDGSSSTCQRLADTEAAGQLTTTWIWEVILSHWHHYSEQPMIFFKGIMSDDNISH